MATNDTGFEFSNNPSSPASDVTAENLNDAIRGAIIRNIAQGAVKSVHLDPEIAGAGLGGTGSSPLYVKTDGQSVEIDNDSIRVKDAGIKTKHLENGAVTNDKLSNDISELINTTAKRHYGVGDYHINEQPDSLTKQYGGEWVKLKDGEILASVNTDSLVSTTKIISLYGVVESWTASDSWGKIYSDGWCEQGGILAPIHDNGEQTVYLTRTFKTPLYANVTTNSARHGTDSDAGNIGIELFNNRVIIRAGRTYSRNPGSTKAYWQAKGYVSLTEEEKEMIATLKIRYVNIRRKISDEDA